MRYKANFRPQYILGMFHSCLCLNTYFLSVLRENRARHLTLFFVTQILNLAIGIRSLAK